MSCFDERFMKEAIKQAKKAYQIDETPIGAVIVYNDRIIARGYNKRETLKNSLCHAEIAAINKACRVLGGWRLHGCDLYVTLEPCPMCAGAVIQSRIDSVYFGAFDKKSGCAGSAADILMPGLFNHDVNVRGGILEEECASLMSDFFKNLRSKKRNGEVK